MWEDILIVGVTTSVKQYEEALTGQPDRNDWDLVPQGPFLVIHGRNEEDDERVWYQTVYLQDTPYSTDEPLWSNRFEVLIGAALNSELFQHYLDEITPEYEPHEDLVRELQCQLRQQTKKLAPIMCDIRSELKDNDWNANGSIRSRLEKVAEKVSEKLVGKVVRVDWDECLSYPGPADHLVPFRPARDDAHFGMECRTKEEIIEEWKASQPVPFREIIERTRNALEEDEEYEAEKKGSTHFWDASDHCEGNEEGTGNWDDVTCLECLKSNPSNLPTCPVCNCRARRNSHAKSGFYRWRLRCNCYDTEWHDTEALARKEWMGKWLLSSLGLERLGII